MNGGAQYNPHTVEEVFRDFKGRRAGIIKALTTDVQEFYHLCDPEKENICLYGYPDERWKINLPVQEVPPEIPEPALGINFARDGKDDKHWLSLVAAHSDAWLVAVAFYFGVSFGFDKADRKHLFTMINDLPTISEVATGTAKKQLSDESGNCSTNVRLEDEDKDDGQDEEEDDTLCGACGENYVADEFWIGCDICEKWFHGKCVKITSARAKHIKQYMCLSCSNNRATP